MATRTWSIANDASTRGSDVDYGNSADQHHPVGRHQSIATIYRTFMKFSVDTSGIASISQAILHMRSTGQSHIGFGSSPTIRVKRLTSTLKNSGGSEGSWSGSADPVRSTEPSSTTSGQSSATNMTRSEGTWDTVDITSIAQAWLSGSTNYGVIVKAEDESSNADAWEFYSKESSYDPYITVTYTATVTNTAPTATPASPVTGSVAEMQYTAGSAWASPRPTLTWTYTDPESNAGSAYQIIVYNDSTGSVGTQLWDSGKISLATVSGATASTQAAATFTEGSYYHWKVMVWDSYDLASSWSATQRFRARWGAAEYYFDTGSSPTAWGAATVGLQGNVTIEFNSTTNTADPGAGLGAWKKSLADVALQRYVRYRVWLLPGSVAPTLNDIRIEYTAAALPVPDNWSRLNGAAIDLSTCMFGTRSLYCPATGYGYQLVAVQPNTRYVISAYCKQSTLENQARLRLMDSNWAVAIATTYWAATDTEWTMQWVTWESGSATSVYVLVSNFTGTVPVWFDAVKVEASTRPTPWRPSSTSAAVTLDASGIRIDGSEGGTLRMRGSTGGTRDTVELGGNGLLLGGDATLYSPTASTIQTDGTLAFGSAGDTNLYRSAANILKTDDALWVAGHAVGEYSTTPSTTTITVAGTYYAVATAEVSFTPAYVGQRCLIALQGNPYADAAGTITYNLRVTDSSNGTITDTVIQARGKTGASNEYQNLGGLRIWTADAVAARKAKLYVTHTGTGAVVTHGIVTVQVYPLP
jgi:hypothetical protein